MDALFLLCQFGAAVSFAGVLWTLLPTRKVGGLTFKRMGALSLSYCVTRKAA